MLSLAKIISGIFRQIEGGSSSSSLSTHLLSECEGHTIGLERYAGCRSVIMVMGKHKSCPHDDGPDADESNGKEKSMMAQKERATTRQGPPKPHLAGNNALHLAINAQDWKTCRQLLTGPNATRLLQERSRGGSTALMLIAQGRCGKWKKGKNHLAKEMLDFVLSNPGGRKSILERRRSLTAADYAARQGNGELAELLRGLEADESAAEAASSDEKLLRCQLCGERLRPRSKVAVLGDSVRKGKEDNALVRCLYEQRSDVVKEIDRNVYHRINQCNNFRKELSETMALVRALGKEMVPCGGTTGVAANGGCAWLNGIEMDPKIYNARTSSKAEAGGIDIAASTSTGQTARNASSSTPNVPPGPSLVPWTAASKASAEWHVIDLCCGKSLTAALVALLFENAFVTCVDRITPSQLPHYKEAGLGEDRIRYVRVDMLAPGDESYATPPFLSEVAAAVKEVGRPKVAVLGVHCCGALSLKAIELYEHLGADCIHLMPCCMPSKKDGRFPKSIFESRDQAVQYVAWAEHLRARLADDQGGWESPSSDTSSGKAAPKEEDFGLKNAVGGSTPKCELVSDVVSVKNALVSCRR
mmetsp:Transcript_27960/g.50966  ORF Transcript_27960/g.50966 Transcript_27960/m.50966 type:complete len:587 (+) Transcript_27960:24-1784(+)